MNGRIELVLRNFYDSNIIHSWGDAPVQTIAAALFLKREDIHFFNNIGYTHSIATHCPYDEELLRQCSCDVTQNYGR
jgi:alpha 1,2-mannosyltransferase